MQGANGTSNPKTTVLQRTAVVSDRRANSTIVGPGQVTGYNMEYNLEAGFMKKYHAVTPNATGRREVVISQFCSSFCNTLW